MIARAVSAVLGMVVLVPNAVCAREHMSIRIGRDAQLILEQREQYGWSEGYRPLLIVNGRRFPMQVETLDRVRRRVVLEHP